jgi:hypothetical protein
MIGNRMYLGLVAAPLLLALASPAQAVTTFASDFETPAYPGTSYIQVPSVQGWTLSSGPSIEIQFGNVAGLSHSGRQHVELDGVGNAAMSRTIDPGTYELSFWYSPRPGVAAGSNGIDLLIDGLVVLSLAEAGGNQTMWSLHTYNFSLAAPGTIEFRATGTSDWLGGYLDDIKLGGGAVPEPASWAMLIAGFAMVGGALRQSRRTRVRYA